MGGTTVNHFCIRELGLDPAIVNLDGGGMAIGHPLGATGARLVGKAAALLRRERGRYALATQCVGGGQGASRQFWKPPEFAKDQREVGFFVGTPAPQR